MSKRKGIQRNKQQNDTKKTKTSQQYLIPKSTPKQRKQWNEQLSQKLLMTFPNDFFDLYDVAVYINPKDPCGIYIYICIHNVI